MTDDPDVRWMSYRELAEIRGIDRASAARVAKRNKWAKRQANDGGIRIAVPLTFIEPSRGRPRDRLGDSPVDNDPDIQRTIISLEARLDLTSEDLERAQSRVRELEEAAIAQQARGHDLKARLDLAMENLERAQAKVRELEAEANGYHERATTAETRAAVAEARAEAVQVVVDRLLERRGVLRRLFRWHGQARSPG